MPYTVSEAHKLFEQLPEFAATRLREISGMAQPYIEVTDRYARLIARLTYLLGHTPPRDTQDRVIRDLLADVFDFLYEARSLIVGGKLSVASCRLHIRLPEERTSHCLCFISVLLSPDGLASGSAVRKSETLRSENTWVLIPWVSQKQR